MRYTLFLLRIYFVFAKSVSLSKIMVTGPSLCISTSISAPNSPVCTFTPLAAVMALNSSYRREASPGSAAPLKLGRPAVAAGSIQRKLRYGKHAAAYIQQT